MIPTEGERMRLKQEGKEDDLIRILANSGMPISTIGIFAEIPITTVRKIFANK